MRQTKLKVTKSAKITDFFKRESDSPRNDQRSRTDSPMTTPTGSEKTPFKVRNKRISSEFIAMDTKNIPTSVNTETKRTGQLLTSASKEDKSNSKEILQYSDNTLQDKADKKRTLFKRHNSVEIIIPKLHIRKAPRSLKKHTSEQNLHSVVNTSKLSTLEKIVNEVLDCTRIKDLHESRPTDQDDYSKISQFKKNKSSVIPPNDEVLVIKSVKNPLTDSKKLKFLKTKNPLQISNMEKRKENNPSIIISKKSWGNFKTSVLVETDNNSLLTRKKSINSEFNVMDIENEENISEKYLENPLGIKQNKQQISALGAIVSSESTTANTPQRIKIIPSEMNVSTPTRMEIIDVDIEIEPDVTSGVLSDGSLFSKMAGAGDGSATNLNESSKVNTDTFSSTGSVNAMVDSSEKDLKSSRPPTLEPDSIEQCVTSEIEPSPSKRPPVKDKQKSKKSVINMDESLDDLFETISPRKKDSRKSPLESFNSSTKKQKIENDNHKSVVHETDHQTSIKDGISKSITFDEDDLLDFAEVPISTTSNPFLSDDEDFLELYKPPATIKKSDNHVMDNSDSDDELLSNLPQSVLNETHKRVTRSATKSVTKPNYLKIGRMQEDFDDMGDMVKSLQSLVKSAKTNKSQMEKYDALSKDLQQVILYNLTCRM
ncbi:hypothetical protein BC833DRAFT_601899 [Globomyces pollinis-pini]|nr:hypothetical protein BC833DRAFT_601899 [Globomyces pollinis-pini]